jgi:hypothetical protein
MAISRIAYVHAKYQRSKIRCYGNVKFRNDNIKSRAYKILYTRMYKRKLFLLYSNFLQLKIKFVQWDFGYYGH